MIYCAAREFMIAFVLLWGMMGTGVIMMVTWNKRSEQFMVATMLMSMALSAYIAYYNCRG
jgi:hypothetical protein